MINPLRKKLHYLIDRISEEDLGKTWKTLQALFYDSYMLKAIEEAKETLKPGDSLTYEEAIETLHFEYSRSSSIYAEPHQPNYPPFPKIHH